MRDFHPCTSASAPLLSLGCTPRMWREYQLAVIPPIKTIRNSLPWRRVAQRSLRFTNIRSHPTPKSAESNSKKGSCW
ncbi:hypothetical protein Egran_05613 [Elaphomyces granulatus]|uniref:Uncharacterized protein n=1 Tax=Elaphomyces granulatus TaxID=519963 RepID=A0A232LR59_9EURO|nr:hypothetical protein Egran_05613 [Elaphomyces granulatus]